GGGISRSLYLPCSPGAAYLCRLPRWIRTLNRSQQYPGTLSYETPTGSSPTITYRAHTRRQTTCGRWLWEQTGNAVGTGSSGADGTHSFTVTRSTGHKSLCLYRAKAYYFRADAVYTHLPITGAMRGYGAPQGFFALESHIDEIARALEMDPLEFRRKNHVQKGDWDPIEGEEVDGVWHSKRQFRSGGLP